MKTITLSFTLCIFSLALAAQDELDIVGSASISESLTAKGITSTQGVNITGFEGLKVTSTGSHVVDLQGDDPLITFSDNTPAYKAFIQSFGNDLYVANRIAGNINFWTSNLNRMTIRPNGDVGIGTSSPTAKLSVNGPENDGTTAGLEILSPSQRTILDGNEIDCTTGGLHFNYNSLNNIMLRTSEHYGEVTMSHTSGSGADNGVSIENPGANNAYWTLYSTNGDGNLELYYKGVFRGEFNSTSGAYTSVSDQKLKENIRPLQDVLPRIKAMKPAVYQFKDDEQHRDSFGFVAQELAQQFPELVHQGHVGDTEEELYTVNYSGLGVVAIAALQELMANGKATDSHALLAENQALQQKVADLEERLAKLEQLVMGSGMGK